MTHVNHQQLRSSRGRRAVEVLAEAVFNELTGKNCERTGEHEGHPTIHVQTDHEFTRPTIAEIIEAVSLATAAVESGKDSPVGQVGEHG